MTKLIAPNRERIEMLRDQGLGVEEAKRVVKGEQLRDLLGAINPTVENVMLKKILREIIDDFYPETWALR